MMKPTHDTPWPDQNLDEEERALDAEIEAAPDPVGADIESLDKVRAALAEAARERRSTHGGPRTGAGRPAKQGVRTMLHLSPESRTALERLAEDRRQTLSETATEIFLKESGKRPTR